MALGILCQRMANEMLQGLDAQGKAKLVEKLQRELIGRGCLRRNLSCQSKSLCFGPVPVSVFPVPISRSLHQKGRAYGPLFNCLCDQMVQNLKWLLEAYSGVRQEDDFVERFCSITERVYVAGNKTINECLRGYVTRSDYLIDEGTNDFKQVEINLSSVVGPHIMTELGGLQRDLLQRHSIPDNDPRTHFAKKLKMMAQVYDAQILPACGFGSAVLFLIEDNEGNLPEILNIIRAISAEGQEVFYATHGDCVEAMSLGFVKGEDVGGSRRLRVDLGGLLGFPHPPGSWKEISCVYLRTGYRPEQYPTEAHWALRELMETTQAIVIPSAVSQLAGLKKVQQLWCIEKNLELLVPDATDRDNLRQCFCPQVDPSDKEAEQVIADAIKNPDEYVLKPQREGGGNNFYGRDIVDLLKAERTKRTSSYVLMQRIHPPEHDCVILRDNALERQRCVSEFGYYASGLWAGSKCIFNETFGHLVRSKEASSNEGGVSINVAVYNSLSLID